ncbi:alpha amylase N-terminal ig-like domain-containing protein [bacterium]|nr:alpha amylase N-terminal ig-like domain-containing protein [bacterium]
MKKQIYLIFLFSIISILSAKTHSITFEYTPNVVPKSVALAGSFNNWSSSAMPMSDDDNDGIWTITIQLEDGEYLYKFVVNGDKWYQDLNNSLSSPDGYGGRNSIIRVGDYGKFTGPAFLGDGKILKDAIYHTQKYPYFARQDSMLWIKLRTKQDDIDSVAIIFYEKAQKMDWYAFDGTFDYYIAEIYPQRNNFSYKFKIYDGDSSFDYSDNFSVEFSQIYNFHTPNWISTSIFYQIFPERFANADKSNDPKDVQRWGGKPEYDNFFGGDLKGVLNHLDYLQNLGVNAIYFNPIFLSPSNHKYDMSDQMKIDPHFGDSALFKTLLDSCHELGIKIMLDGVYHDTGRKHWAFQDVIRNGAKSKYANWFTIYSFPVASIEKPNYKCWWNFGSLPSLNTDNPDVRKFLFDFTRYWMKLGIDGLRLDCANETGDEFWTEFRDSVRKINPDAYILGEIWGDGSRWLKGDMFDAVMNYRFRDACLDFFAYDKISSHQFAEKYFTILASYLPNVNFASFNLLGSHDTPRFLTLCKNDSRKLKLATFFQLTAIGAPSIYYGDEIGLTGDKDPDCRKCFVWDTLGQNRELLQYIKKLISIRKKYPVISQGNIYKFDTPTDDCIILYKKYRGQNAIILINREDSEILYKIDEPAKYFEDAMTGQKISLEKSDGIYNIPANIGRILIFNHRNG